MKMIYSLLAILLAGCQNLGYSGMSAEQIKATAGTTTCTQYAGLYGKASAIALNADDVRKGVTSNGDMTITCGDASMQIKNTIGLPSAPVVK